MAISFGDPVMVDLETLGTRPRSVILSIGAVKFDPDTQDTHTDFYLVINKQSCLDVGMEASEDTLKWWSEQDPEAQKVLKLAESSVVTLKEALERFANWIDPNTTIWGNGSDFDVSMLQEAYALCGMKQPWAFWNNRCYRTMKNQVRVTHKRQGTHHNALDDARYQAEHLMKILAKMRG